MIDFQAINAGIPRFISCFNLVVNETGHGKFLQ